MSKDWSKNKMNDLEYIKLHESTSLKWLEFNNDLHLSNTSDIKSINPNADKNYKPHSLPRIRYYI